MVTVIYHFDHSHSVSIEKFLLALMKRNPRKVKIPSWVICFRQPMMP